MNDKICPEDQLLILLPAHKIPDGSTVRKRNGEVDYTLRRNLKVYLTEKSPFEITGYFLVGVRGDINQVEEGRYLHWVTTAEDMVQDLQCSWEMENQQ